MFVYNYILCIYLYIFIFIHAYFNIPVTVIQGIRMPAAVSHNSVFIIVLL